MPDCDHCPKAKARPQVRWAAPRREIPLSGILNLDKPPGITSHDVVDAVRRMAGQRKVGHAGTLDPMATGVLLLCLGSATRVAEYLMAGRKRYRATIVFGTTTDTDDAEGRVVRAGGRTDFGRGEIDGALSSFVGRLEQVPPAYSALKRDGQPLYKLARKGEVVEVAARLAEVDEITMLDWAPPRLVIEVACSPGTYIRSLARDLGQYLGSGAHLASLVRLRSGRFTLEEAVSLERLEEAFQHGQEIRYLMPLDEALLELPVLVVGREDGRRVMNGQEIRGEPHAVAVHEGAEILSRVYSAEGDFLAVMAYDPGTGGWRPKKVFGPG